MAVPAEQRRLWGGAIEERLRALLAGRRGLRLGVYWPFKAEFDPRPLIDWLIAEGSAVALPALVDGVWGIPVPQRREIVIPDAVLAPLVGFDEAGYRLGYGGGYFDRTLAALVPKPLAIGVGFELARLPTIHPQPFDVPMDFIVTEAALRRR